MRPNHLVITKTVFGSFLGGLPRAPAHLQSHQRVGQLLRCHPQWADGPRGQAAGQRPAGNHHGRVPALYPEHLWCHPIH